MLPFLLMILRGAHMTLASVRQGTLKTGISNSNSYEGRISQQIEPSTRVCRIKCLRGPQYKKGHISCTTHEHIFNNEILRMSHLKVVILPIFRCTLNNIIEY